MTSSIVLIQAFDFEGGILRLNDLVNDVIHRSPYEWCVDHITYIEAKTVWIAALRQLSNVSISH